MPRLKEKQGGGRRELISERKPKDRTQPKNRSVEGETIFSPVEQGERKFEITEREKYLLEVIAHVITEGYFPHLHRHDPESKGYVEESLLSEIDRLAVTSEQGLKRRRKKQ